MNKYEVYLEITDGPRRRVLEFLQTDPRPLFWAGIDEVIARPEIFPLQLSMEYRTQLLAGWKREGGLFIVTGSRGVDGLYSIMALHLPPSLRYRHISKLWRECK
jgi:hypothetical protein